MTARGLCRRAIGVVATLVALLGTAGAAPADCTTAATSMGSQRGDDAAPMPLASLPASLLVSRPDLPFKIGRTTLGGVVRTVLAYPRPDAPPSAAAKLWSFGSGAEGRVCIELLPAAGPDSIVFRRATLEHLYGLVSQEDPQARYCFVDAAHRCSGPGRGASSQAALLREVARARARAGGGGRPWRVVTLVALAGTLAESEVGVRVADERGPIRGASVFFHRAPHWGCVATSLPDGAARCVLRDDHGDEESHAGEAHAPVLATYPGLVGEKRTLLPTTLMIGAPR